MNYVSRLEFQDGKRKRGTQKYHGRGTVHSHSLDYTQNTGAIGLEKKLSATVPFAADPMLRGLLFGEEPSAWDDTEQKVLL